MKKGVSALCRREVKSFLFIHHPPRSKCDRSISNDACYDRKNESVEGPAFRVCDNREDLKSICDHSE